jgi:hypothetical protein
VRRDEGAQHAGGTRSNDYGIRFHSAQIIATRPMLA